MLTPKKIAIEPTETGLYWEGRVSEALGIPRKTLAELRKGHLTAGPDFVRLENNAVALTAKGLAVIQRLVTETGPDGQMPGKPGKTGGKPGPSDVPKGPPPREIMRIERVPQNPGLLLCITTTRPTPILVAVRVRENTNFAAGMDVETIQSGDGVWQFRNRPKSDESTVGRLPRAKGRW